MKTKTFDCVEMKRQGAEKVQQELAGMTLEEEIAFWQSGTDELQRRQVQAAAKLKTGSEMGQAESKRQGLS